MQSRLQLRPFVFLTTGTIPERRETEHFIVERSINESSKPMSSRPNQLPALFYDAGRQSSVAGSNSGRGIDSVFFYAVLRCLVMTEEFQWAYTPFT